ncbi:MAG: FHA domain-containing protein [Bdellovibrionales bacterium]|nr:FHA domain-containing protein [Bdellovibrionales bacterium]NQZ17813.1 FHA domain-containing protein [Bdellovibrionales bacterium]
MKLLVLKSGSTVAELELQSGGIYTIGRKKDCDVQLESIPGISREHFRIEEDESGMWSIHVISKVTPLKFNGQEHYDLVIEEDLTVGLLDYRFQFITGFSEEEVSEEVHIDHNEQVPALVDDEEALENVSFNDLDEEAADEVEDKTFVGNEEKTNIQNFAGTPYVKIIGQNGKKSEFFRLEGNLWVAGRDDSASIYINDPSASQNHFEISKTDKGFFISDLDSAEGTILNGQRLEAHSPSPLKSGDIINVAAQSLQFELRDQAFKKKVSNIPLHMYQNPLVFFEQETAMVTSRSLRNWICRRG